MSRLISTGNVNSNTEHIGENGSIFLLSFKKASTKIDKDDLWAPSVNKMCVVLVKNVTELETTMVSVVLLDSDKAASVPEEYIESGTYWVKLGELHTSEQEETTGSIQFSDRWQRKQY